MPYAFYLGIDATDEPNVLTATLLEKAGDYDEEPMYRVHRILHLTDDEAEQDAAAVASSLQSLIAETPYTGRTEIVVNERSDVGFDVLEALTDLGLTPIGITITGGDAATEVASGLARTSGDADDEISSGMLVSEHVLVQALQELYRGGRLDMAEEEATDHASRLAQGLQSYRARSTEAGDALQDIDAVPRRDADHAEYVLSAALAAWFAKQHTFNESERLSGDLPPIRSAKRPDQGLPAS